MRVLPKLAPSKVACLWVGGVIGIAVAACAGPQPRVTTAIASQQRLMEARTFDIQPGVIIANEVIGREDSWVRERVENALRATLEARGLKADPAAPDLIVTYEVSLYREPPAGTDWVTRPESWDEQMANRAVLWRPVPRMDMLVVHVLDGRTQASLFRSVADARGQPLRQTRHVMNVVDRATEHMPAATPAIEMAPLDERPAADDWLQLN
jgi:hypothetical protein